MYAIDAESGDERWRFEAGGLARNSEILSDDSILFHASPTVVDSTVYIGGWRRSGESNVLALDAASGSERWSIDFESKVSSSPTVVDGAVFIGDWSGRVYRFDTEDGTKQWQFRTDASIESSPTVVDGVVYIGSNDGNLYAIDAESGEKLWRLQTNRPVTSSPTVADGVVFVGSWDFSLNAVDTETGLLQWERELGWEIFSSPTVADGVVFVGIGEPDHVGSVYALNAATGETRWRHSIDAVIESSPTVAGDTVFIGAEDGTLYALSRGDGTERWRFETDGEVSSSPVVVDGTVYVGSKDGSVYALEAGVTGSSEDSRVLLGTLGHDRSWAGETPREITVEERGRDMRTMATVGGGTIGTFLTLLGAYSVSRRILSDDTEHGSAESQSNAPQQGTEHRAPSNASQGPPDDIPRTPSFELEYETFDWEERIDGGNSTEMYRATVSTDAGRLPIAVKTLRSDGTIRTERIKRFIDGAGTWSQLADHDHVVGVIDYDMSPFPWIGMEYMDAGHLGQRVGELPFEQSLWTALAVTTAVRHAHRHGVAHLDLTPRNVLFRSAPNAWDVPKVADWGLTVDDRLRGEDDGYALQYAAPEQFDSAYGAADNVTDVYRLGAILYELFTGRPPFDADSTSLTDSVLTEQPQPPSAVADIPVQLDGILLTALATEKDDRYESVLYLRDALKGLR